MNENEVQLKEKWKKKQIFWLEYRLEMLWGIVQRRNDGS